MSDLDFQVLADEEAVLVIIVSPLSGIKYHRIPLEETDDGIFEEFIISPNGKETIQGSDPYAFGQIDLSKDYELATSGESNGTEKYLWIRIQDGGNSSVRRSSHRVRRKKSG